MTGQVCPQNTLGADILYSLFAFDLDDTLLNEKTMLTPRTKAALDAVKAAGGYIAISTGRMIEAAQGVAETIGVNAPTILYNGALIYDYGTKRVVSKRAIDFDTARKILKMCEDMGVYMQAYPGENFYADVRTEYTAWYESHLPVICHEVRQPLSTWITGDQIKLLAIGEVEKIAEAKRVLSERFTNVTFLNSKPSYLEMNAKGIDKGWALSKAAEDLGIPRESVVAFGDGGNDVPMIKWAGAGYCMMNAADFVRDKCDTFCRSNRDDGCARVIEAMLEKGLVGRRDA